jgi:hypothetical protein
MFIFSFRFQMTIFFINSKMHWNIDNKGYFDKNYFSRKNWCVKSEFNWTIQIFSVAFIEKQIIIEKTVAAWKK